MALAHRRRMLGFLLAVLTLTALTVVLVALRGKLDLSSILLLYLSTVVAVATVGGIWPAVAAAVAGSALSNWYFTPPLHTWTIDSTHDVVALSVFLVVAATVSGLVEVAARRDLDATRARSESASLARLAATVLDSEDPLQQLVHDLRATFGLDSVAIMTPDADGWRVQIASGSPELGSPDDGTDAIALSSDAMLVLTGPRTPADDRRLLAAFAAQLAIALANRQLQVEASRALALAEADRLRTALLAAVSHDLRTPLSSIKASATSLLQSDVQWSAAEADQFLEAIVTEADRLNGLVGNLLDMSRIRTGAVQVHSRPVGLDEILPAALSGLQVPTEMVEVDVAETLPSVNADPALLERVIANLVANALAWSPQGTPVCIQAVDLDGRVDVRIIDRGAGIPADSRERVFEPFQRLQDHSNGSGVGLGLAVARGFTEAMGGRIGVDATPGGGTTMVLSLEALR